MDTMLTFVLTNLSNVIRQESAQLGELAGELHSIKDELQLMMGFLQMADSLVEDHPDVEAIVRQVRDVSYDVEDVLDEFVMRCTSNYSSGFRGRVQNAFFKIKTMKARRQVAVEIRAIRKRIADMSTAHERYQSKYGSVTPATGSSSSSFMHNTPYDRRGDALLLEEADLVGIEKPKQELSAMILSDDTRRNVVSVVGMGGLGKTTLVKKVYDAAAVRSQFSLHAWITVSESIKLEELFRGAVKQLLKEEGRQFPGELDAMDIDGLKLLVLEILHSKSYLIVFDDVWSVSDWDAIHLAFPRNQSRSRVVITTRITEVCQAASRSETGGSVYHLRPLPEEAASTLFCRKAFRGATSCPLHLEQICQKILRACEGLPLAIVVLGGTLATKSRRTEEWDLFYRSIGAELECNSKLDVMTRILSLSYYDLPNHLRICFLYLSILPEDAVIGKKTIKELWIAEGFVGKREGVTMEEVAEGYLNELLSRSLVQVADTFVDGRVMEIRIHDIVRHIILLKASQQNITTILRGHGVLQDKIRRLVIHGSTDNIAQLESKCKSLRALILFDYVSREIAEQLLSDLLCHSRRLLKVLDLYRAPLEVIPDEIFKLIHLKYLNLTGTKLKYVPKAVGKLRNLKTLDLSETLVSELPINILKLQQLQRLSVHRTNDRAFENVQFDYLQGFRAPYKIGTLKSLEHLHVIEANEAENVNAMEEIGKLIQLRVLGISKLRRDDGMELCSSLGKLTQLRELHLFSLEEKEVLDLQYPLSSNLPFLHTILLTGRLEKFPPWISYLQGLTSIHLEWSRLRDDPLQGLQDLPNLVQLILKYAYKGEGLSFNAGAFQRLKELSLESLEELRWVKVEEGTMPFLETLVLVDCPCPTGIEHLMRLQELEFQNRSGKFANEIDDMDKHGVTFKKILMIPQVKIFNWVDGKWQVRNLDKDTGMAN